MCPLIRRNAFEMGLGRGERAVKNEDAVSVSTPLGIALASGVSVLSCFRDTEDQVSSPVP